MKVLCPQNKNSEEYWGKNCLREQKDWLKFVGWDSDLYYFKYQKRYNLILCSRLDDTGHTHTYKKQPRTKRNQEQKENERKYTNCQCLSPGDEISDS